MKLSVYLKMVVWELVLLVLASTGLGYLLLQAFYAGDAVAGTPLPAVVSVVCTCALFLIASSKRLLLPGGIVFGVACLAALAGSIVASPAGPVSDEPGNYLIVTTVLLATSIVPFFLSRKRTGGIVLLIAGIFACSWMQFYYGIDQLVWSLIVLFSCLALIVYKNYQHSARTAMAAKKVSFPLGFGMAIGTVAVAVALGALTWFAVIAPLHPGALKVELVTEERAYETFEVQGTMKQVQTPDTSLTSSGLNDGERTTDDLVVSDDGIPTPARVKNDSSKQSKTQGTFLGIDIDSLQEAFDFQANPTGAAWRLALLVLLPLLIIIGYFIGRRLWRRRRLSKIMQLPPGGQASRLYTFVLGRLGRIGFDVPAGMTLAEFAKHNASSLSQYDELAGATFSGASATYMNMAYGGIEPSEAEVGALASYYCAFWKFARRRLGNFKYFLKSFRL